MSIGGGWFCAAAHFLCYLLGNLLYYLPWNLIANFLRYLYTCLLRDFLFHIYRILRADSFREILALFSGNIYGKVLTLFLWDFLAFCSGNCLLYFLRLLLAMLLWNLKFDNIAEPQL